MTYRVDDGGFGEQGLDETKEKKITREFVDNASRRFAALSQDCQVALR